MSVVRDRQAPLRVAYRERPSEALTRKWAATSARTVPPTDPFHGEVEVGAGFATLVPYGIDHAIGGLHDLPNPGDLVCAALASCADATIRMAAEAYGVVLADLSVEFLATGTRAVRSASTAMCASACKRSTAGSPSRPLPTPTDASSTRSSLPQSATA